MKRMFLFALLTVLACSCEKKDDLPVIELPKKSYAIESYGGLVEVFMQTNAPVSIEVENKEWLRSAATKSLKLDVIALQCDTNKSYTERVNHIYLSTSDGLLKDTIQVVQRGAPAATGGIKGFVFETAKNKSLIWEDIRGVILSDNRIIVNLPYFIVHNRMAPTFEMEGYKIVSPTADTVDFTEPVTYIIENMAGKQTEYVVEVSGKQLIPILRLNTEGGAPIVSRDVYINGEVDFDGGEVTPSLQATTQVKGRGNTTWSFFPKKPYRLKFDKKQSLAGFPEHKDWVLLANYSDKTALRTELAFDLSRRSRLSYTPRSTYVDLFLNGSYNGIYQLTEQLKVNDNRINVGDNGFLLEVDQIERLEEGDVFFRSPKGIVLNIKDPDVEPNSADLAWIEDYVARAENALYSPNFQDPETGYAKYLNVESFVDWYLVNEIAKNNDAAFYSSCFMNIRRGEKLNMGPVWDFDISFGNVNHSNNDKPEGFWIKNSGWISRLFRDPAFVAQVKARFPHFKSQMASVLVNLDNQMGRIKSSRLQDDVIWKTLGRLTWPNPAFYGSYDDEVDHLRDWLTKRMNWLDAEFKKM